MEAKPRASQHQTIVVVPCYNEAQRLDLDAFREFAASAPTVGFVFVNDGSTDATRETLGSLVSSNPTSFALLSLDRNLGKAEAVRAGILDAIQRGASRVGYWDADLATPLKELLRFGLLLDEDPSRLAVLGSRVSRLGAQIERHPGRHYVGRLFATVASLVLGMQVYDTQCGAKLFRADEELVGAFAAPFRSRWGFDVELLMRLRLALGADCSQRIYEQPLETWRDVAGSKVGLGAGLQALFELFVIWRRYR